jgi:DNA primase
MAQRVSPAQIEEIIDKNDIVSVVSEYVKLKRSGSNYLGLCPFHNEKTPSFSVSESKRLFKCFGCGKGGGVVQFIMLAENLDYFGALKYLAERAGITLNLTQREDNDDRQKLKNDVLSLNNRAQQFFREALTRSEAGKAYIARRGLTPETVEKFGIGFAPDDWSQLTNICTTGALAVPQELMVTAGLALRREKGDGCYDRFRNRVMFPIFDEMGKIVAFGGRVMDDSKPKYMNSPETPAYNKGSHLYALNFARKSGSKRVIIVEGYMDAIALHQKGIDWAVASLGTALTQGQARLLKRYFDEVFIGYDSDSAGQNATVRGLEILAAQGLKVNILNLGSVDASVKDPDEFLRKHPPEDFMQVVDKAVSLVEFKIALAAKASPPDSARTLPDFLRQVVKIIAAEPSASVRTLYIDRVAETYDIDSFSLREDVDARIAGGAEITEERAAGAYRRVQYRADNIPDTPPIPDDPGEPAPKAELSPDGERLDRLEKRMLIYLVSNPAEIPQHIDRCRTDFCFEENKKLANKIHLWYINGYAVSREMLLAECSAELASELTDEFEQVGPRATASEIIKNMEKFRFKYEYGVLSDRLKNAGSAAEKSGIMKEINELIVRSRPRK